MQTFTDWKEAHTFAVRYARQLHMDVALRKVRHYGKPLFAVTLASRNDSDYVMAEIVRPGDPL